MEARLRDARGRVDDAGGGGSAPRADAVTAAGGGPGGAPAGDLVDRLVAEGMSRLSAERAVAIRAGAEPSRARRHGRSGW